MGTLRTEMRSLVRVVLEREWLGNPVGTELEVSLDAAERLREQGAARMADGNDVTKQMSAAPKHRMVERAVKSK